MLYKLNDYILPLLIMFAAAFSNWHPMFIWPTFTLTLVHFLLNWYDVPLTGTMTIFDGDKVTIDLESTRSDLKKYKRAKLNIAQQKGGEE